MINKDLTINKELCISCGACKLACEVGHLGNGCITMEEQDNYRFIPEVNKSKCTKCFKCYSACPIHFNKMRNSISKNSFNDDEKKCFVGYSNDKEHRKNAATAGVATQIIIDSLNNKTIDAAIMTRGTSNGGFDVLLVKNEEEVRSCRGSIYRPVNLLANISQYIINNDIKKLAIVGAPCHIHGIKNICKINENLNLKLVFTVAIFCKQNKEKGFTDFIKSLTDFSGNEWSIRYRGNGWPGYTTIKNNKNNYEKSIPCNDGKLSTLWGMQTFTPIGCFMCSDPLGEIADISLGDAWLNKYVNVDKLGTEFIIANTNMGLDILNQSLNIIKSSTSFGDILMSQSNDLIEFKRNINKDRFADIQSYSINKNLSQIVQSKDLKFYLNSKNISENKLFLSTNRKLPSKIIRIYMILRQKQYSILNKN